MILQVKIRSNGAWKSKDTCTIMSLRTSSFECKIFEKGCGVINGSRGIGWCMKVLVDVQG